MEDILYLLWVDLGYAHMGLFELRLEPTWVPVLGILFS